MYIARQAIFDRDLKVYAYELLYRANKDANTFGGASSNVATASVIAGTFENGVGLIADKKKAFINFDEEMLFSDLPYLLKPNELVIENLETVQGTPSVVKRIKKLRRDGYSIALDDFVHSYDEYPLVQYANIIKYDLLATPLDSIEGDVKKALYAGKIVLAEKVETRQEFERAKEMGFHLFQGYFFQKPQTVGQSDDKVSYATHYALIMSELNKREPSYNKLAEIFQTNTDLAYRMMKISGSKSDSKDIRSIKKALTFLGLNELRMWTSALMIRDMGKNKPSELMRLSLIRGRFAELLTQRKFFAISSSESFMLGLFSTIDAFMDKKMEDILLDLPFSDDCKNALLRKDGSMSGLLDFILDYEAGSISSNARYPLFTEKEMIDIFKIYMLAVKWGTDLYNSI